MKSVLLLSVISFFQLFSDISGGHLDIESNLNRKTEQSTFTLNEFDLIQKKGNSNSPGKFEFMVGSGYSRLYCKYPALFIGASARYSTDNWGVDLSYCSNTYETILIIFPLEIIAQNAFIITPFLTHKITDALKVSYGMGPGVSKNKFDMFWKPTERYYFLDTSVFLQTDYNLQTKFLKRIGVEVRAIHPTYCYHQKEREENYKPKKPTAMFSLMLGF